MGTYDINFGCVGVTQLTCSFLSHDSQPGESSLKPNEKARSDGGSHIHIYI